MKRKHPASDHEGVRRVLVVNQYALPRTEGGGTRHIDLFGRLTTYEPVIVATSRHHTTQQLFTTDDPRFRLVSTPPYEGNGAGRVVGWLVFSLKAMSVGLRLRPLHVVYASTPHLFAVLAGYAVSRLRRVPLVVEVRDLWPESIVAAGLMRRGGIAHRSFSLLERFVYHRAAHIVVVTDGWTDHFTALGISSDRLSIIPNGTELSDFAAKGTRAQARERWGVTGTTAVFAGSHGPKDGIELILDAAQALPDVNFLLVGAGSSKSSAEAHARDHALTNVRFLDAVPKTDLPSLLAACDIGVHAVTPLSVFDRGMSPNKLFDYMAAGLPVVSNAGAALRRVTRDGECGRIGGPQDLAQCLWDVAAASSEQRQRWADNGRRLVQERFSRAAAAQQLEDTLDRVLGAQKSTTPR